MSQELKPACWQRCRCFMLQAVNTV